MQTPSHPTRTIAGNVVRLILGALGYLDVGTRRLRKGQAAASGDESFSADRTHLYASIASRHGDLFRANVSSPPHRLTMIAAAQCLEPACRSSAMATRSRRVFAGGGSAQLDKNIQPVASTGAAKGCIVDFRNNKHLYKFAKIIRT